MRRQLTYLRDGHYIDSDTAHLTSVLAIRLSDNASFALVEIRTRQMSAGGFEQTGRVWSIASVKAGVHKLHVAKWMVVKLGPAACALFMAGYLFVTMVCFAPTGHLTSSDHPNRLTPWLSTATLCKTPLSPRHKELRLSV
jgi:hypothetical protein